MTATKELFKSTVRHYIKRKGIIELLDALEKTDFYTAPASSKYHGSHESGLLIHSLNVFQAIDEIKQDKYDKESLVIVALFHDLCKVGYYKVDSRNTKDSAGKWIQVPYYSVDDRFPLGHGEKSVMLILEHMKLTVDEMLAIRWHMAGFEPKENYATLSKAYSACPLCVYLSNADMLATYTMDRKGE